MAVVEAVKSSVDWCTINKNKDEVPSDAEIVLLDDSESKYVSRGGLKLEGALLSSGLSVEGLRCLEVPAFSVQYHPEAAAGPHDSAYLFDDFIDLMSSPGKVRA